MQCQMKISFLTQQPQNLGHNLQDEIKKQTKLPYYVFFHGMENLVLIHHLPIRDEEEFFGHAYIIRLI